MASRTRQMGRITWRRKLRRFELDFMRKAAAFVASLG
jgi:hypothetical protein